MHSIEPLESRIAPATLVNPTTVSYTDLDGDAVTVKVSAGTFIFTGPNGGGSNSLTFTAANAGGGQQLKQIFLQSADFSGANLTVSVVKKPGGDGLANVGEIITGRDLGAVSINGDLGDILCGDAITDTGFGLKSLTVRSMGRFFGSTGGGVGNGDNTLESHVFGTLGKLVVKGDVENSWLHVTGNMGDDMHGIIGSVSIGGSLIGGSTRRAGGIECSGDIGTVKIGRDLQGGTAEAAGYINSVTGKIGSITIGGSVIGGSGQDAGGIHGSVSLGSMKIGGSLIGGSGRFSAQIQISSGSINQLKIGGDIVGDNAEQAGFVNAFTIGSATVGGSAVGAAGRFSGSIFGGSALLGPVKIGGSVIGGSGNDSGSIGANGKVGNVTVGGSVIGGTDAGTGGISGGGDMGVVKIGRDLVGGSILGTTPDLGFSGYIQSEGRIASVTIGGSVISGIDTSTSGDLFADGSIRAGDDIGSLTVKGSLIGHANTGTGASPVTISARGQDAMSPALTATSDMAIGRVTIGGRVEFASILAGYNTILVAKNANAQIGPVKVGGDWIASNIVAGVMDTGAAGFGDAGDSMIGGGTNIAKIASIVIGGQVVGTPGADRFGFVSHMIGSFKAAGFTAPFVAAATSEAFELALASGDVTVREV
jgi:hypothetical protein